MCALVLSMASLAVEQPSLGLFGWALLDSPLPLLFALFAFAVGVLGLLACNYTVGVLPTLIVSSSTLIGPGLTGVISYLAGLEGIPQWYTLVGGSIVLSGLGIMTYSENRHPQSRVGIDLDQPLDSPDYSDEGFAVHEDEGVSRSGLSDGIELQVR